MDFISQFAVSLDAILGVDKDMTQYLDAHTHSDVHKDDVIAVVNRYPGEVCTDDKCVSVGLHPWYVGEDWREKVETMRSDAFSPNVCAIGECGLDKLTGNDYERQKHAFRAQVSLAEECGKPMIIHCVKAYDDILELRCILRLCQSRLALLLQALRLGEVCLGHQLCRHGKHVLWRRRPHR